MKPYRNQCSEAGELVHDYKLAAVRKRYTEEGRNGEKERRPSAERLMKRKHRSKQPHRRRVYTC